LFSKESIEYLRKAVSEGRVSRGPIDLQILLTTRCNERCVFCPAQAVSERGKKNFAPRWQMPECDLNFGIFDRLCDDLYRLGGLKRVHITGGEPLLYKRIMAVIFLLRSSFPEAELALVTNGILLSEFASALVASGIERISISVNAGTEESFGLQSGVSGFNFEKVKTGIKAVRKERERKALKKPYLSLTAVLNKHNYQKVEELLRLGIETGADALSFLPLMDFPFAGEEARSFAITESEFESFLRSLDELKPYAEKHKIYLGYTGDREHSGKLRSGDKYKKLRCWSGYSFAMVWPDGSVRPCCNCENVLGNLHEQSFYRIWTSERAQKIRERMLEIVEKGPPEGCDCLECGYLYENQEFERRLREK